MDVMGEQLVILIPRLGDYTPRLSRHAWGKPRRPGLSHV